MKVVVNNSGRHSQMQIQVAFWLYVQQTSVMAGRGMEAEFRAPTSVCDGSHLASRGCD